MGIDPILVEFDRRMYQLACAEFALEIDTGFSRISLVRGSANYKRLEPLRRLNRPNLQEYSQILPKRVRRWLIEADPFFFGDRDKSQVNAFLAVLDVFWPQSVEYLRMADAEVKLEVDATKKPLARQIRRALAKKVKARDYGLKDRELQLISPYEIALNKQIGNYELCTVVDLTKPFAMSYSNEVTNESIGTNALAEDFMVTLGIAPAIWRYSNEAEAMESFDHMMGIAGYFSEKMETILGEMQGLGPTGGNAP